MAPRQLAPVLAEIQEALDGISRATEGKSFDEYRSDWLLRRGVERAIEIISEATRHIPDERLSEHPTIPWAQIRGVGNVLRHEYHRVADAIIWSVVTEHLPPLQAAIRDLHEKESNK